MVLTLLLTASVMAYCQLNASGGRVPTGGCGSPVEGGTVDAEAKLVSVLVDKVVAITMTTLVM